MAMSIELMKTGWRRKVLQKEFLDQRTTNGTMEGEGKNSLATNVETGQVKLQPVVPTKEVVSYKYVTLS